MGYRSEVALVLSKEDYIYGLKWMKQNNIPDEINELLPTNTNKIIERSDKIIIYYAEVKWYRTFCCFESLVALYAFLYTLGNERYCVLRIGEDMTDIEIEGTELNLYEADVYPVSMIELGDYSDDIEVDTVRMESLLKENNYYRIFTKPGKGLMKTCLI